MKLRETSFENLDSLRRNPVDAGVLVAAGRIVDDVRERGLPALREHAERLGDLLPDESPFVDRATCEAALEDLDDADRALLERTAERIRAFATAQREALAEVAIEIPGGQAGHVVAPMEVAGCYAPGGRFPLPSSVLMTAVTARAAGVDTVCVASPRPTAVTLAAAAVADADLLLRVGGAQAIAALAYGAGPIPACDVIVGPGNKWVTAAKQLVSGSVAIDMLAGPSELVVLADGSADPAVVAADLLAQAEHDVDAIPVLVTTEATLVEAVEKELERQLDTLPTADTARAALENGLAVRVESVEQGIEACDRLAPEHLEVHLAHDSAGALDPGRFAHYGGLFLGTAAAEVLGDYGAGPNHVLPTGGTARSAGGLSVLDFLRVRTWLRIDDRPEARQLYEDAAHLARLEGLEAHARSAEQRLEQDRPD